MTPALERLAELVRQAEAKTRARKIEGETQHAAEQFRAAELRARQAVEQLRHVRPASLRALEQADADEQLLKDLVRKLALYKSSLGSEADAERLIAASQAEIERTRQQTRIELEEIGARLRTPGASSVRPPISTASSVASSIGSSPSWLAQFSAEDRLLWDAESHFPGGQLQLLGHEVDAGFNAFASLSEARAIRTTQGLDRPLPPLPGFPRPRGRGDRRAPGPVAPGFPPAQVAFEAVRARLHRGVSPGLLDRLVRATWPRPRSSWSRRSRPAAGLATPSCMLTLTAIMNMAPQGTRHLSPATTALGS